MDALRRLVSILIGVLIACATQLLVLPIWARRQLTERLGDSLHDAVDLLVATHAKATSRPAGGDGGVPGSQTAALQRAQRKKASALDALLAATTVVRALKSAGGWVGPWDSQQPGTCMHSSGS